MDVSLDQLASPSAPEHLHRLRRQHPVSWMSALDGWLVTGRDAALIALRDAESFTVEDERFSTAIVVGPSMLSTDGEDHARQRMPFVAPFSVASIAADHIADVDARARALVTSLAPTGRAELRTELAGPLAVHVIIDALGLDVTADDLLGWYRSIVAGVDAVSVGQPIATSTRQAVQALQVAVMRSVDEPTSMLAAVAKTLAPDEVFSNTAVLLFGAIETSEGMTSNALWQLFTVPGMFHRVRAERSLVPDLIEESLRLEPAAAVVDRYATCDIELAGASIRRGDLVRISLQGANRDPATFAEPDRCDVDRLNLRQHLAFVQGPHVCLGLHLARAQTAAAINAVLDELPSADFDVSASSPATGLIFRKPASLSVRW